VLLSQKSHGVGVRVGGLQVIFAELHWTPAILMQAEDRAHRIGQAQHVHVVSHGAPDWSMANREGESVMCGQVYLMPEGNTPDTLVWNIMKKKVRLWLSDPLLGRPWTCSCMRWGCVQERMLDGVLGGEQFSGLLEQALVRNFGDGDDPSGGGDGGGGGPGDAPDGGPQGGHGRGGGLNPSGRPPDW
jgi:hypothetical protein